MFACEGGILGRGYPTMRHSNRANALVRASLLISASTAALMLPATAWAQTADQPPAPPADQAPPPAGEQLPPADNQPLPSAVTTAPAASTGRADQSIVITGSRIRRTEASSAAPLQI